MGVLVLSGERANLLARARSVAMSPAASAIAPATYLYDGRPGRYARFSTAAASARIDVDLEQIVNGSFETWAGGVPSGWSVETSGASTATQDTVTKYDGTSSAKLVKATGTNCRVRQSCTVRAGELVRVRAAVRGSGSLSSVIDVYVRNLTTGRWLNMEPAWTASQEPLLSQAVAEWKIVDLRVACESIAAAWTDLQTVEILVQHSGDSGTAVWVDDISIVPAASFVSVHGHNLTPVTTVELRRSDDAFANTDLPVATLAPFGPEPVCWRRLPVTYSRYWRCLFTGAPPSPLWIGEFVLGQPTDLPRGHALQPGWEARSSRRQASVTTAAGARLGTRLRTVAPDRGLRLSWRFVTADEAEFARREIAWRSQDGALPLVIVPYYNDAVPPATPTAAERTCVLGHIAPDWPVQMRVPIGSADVDIVVAEAGFPPEDEL